MSFPTSPITGQVHPEDGKVWQFNGTAWQAFKTPVYWFAVIGKPTTFPPSAHTHQIADTTGLQAELDTFVQNGGGVARIERVTAMPATPDTNTLYIVIP